MTWLISNETCSSPQVVNYLNFKAPKLYIYRSKSKNCCTCIETLASILCCKELPSFYEKNATHILKGDFHSRFLLQFVGKNLIKGVFAFQENQAFTGPTRRYNGSVGYDSITEKFFVYYFPRLIWAFFVCRSINYGFIIYF